MFNIDTTNASDFDFALSDGTPVEFVKITSRDNIQVRIPSDHPEANGDPLKIFRRDGSHYKDDLDVTLRATPKPAETENAAAATADTGVPVDFFTAIVTALTPPAPTGDDGKHVVRGNYVYELVLVGELAA